MVNSQKTGRALIRDHREDIGEGRSRKGNMDLSLKSSGIGVDLNDTLPKLLTEQLLNAISPKALDAGSPAGC